MTEEPNDEVLSTWTIYDHPTDFPDCFVARRFVVARGGMVRPADDDALTSTEIDVLRRTFENWGLTCLTRSPEDDPNIVETWL